MGLRHRCFSESLERRLCLALEPALAPVVVTPDANLLVQSASSASLGTGGKAVAAYSDRDSGTGKGKDVFLRRLNATGSAINGVTSVNATTNGAQMNPDVAAGPNEKAYVVWQSEGQDGAGWGVYLRAYNADGSALTGEVQVSNVTAGDQIMPRVALDGAGNAVVCWTVQNGDGSTDVYARRFDANGSPLGNEFRVSPAISNGRFETPDVAATATGFAIVWTTINVATDGNADVQARFYDGSADAIGAAVTVNTSLPGEQVSPAVASLGTTPAGDPRYAIAWADTGTSDPEATIRFRIYSTAGVARSNVTQANQDSLGDRSGPRIAGGGNGNFVVGWTQQRSDAVFGYRFARAFTSDLAPASNESQSGDNSSAQTLFGLVRTGDGTFLDLAAAGESIGSGVLTATAFRNVISFADVVGAADTVTVRDLAAAIDLVRVTVNGATQDLARADYAGLRIELGSGNDVLDASSTTLTATVNGGAGDDTVYTGSGTDSLAGGSGDSVLGGDGNDVVYLSFGNDYAFGDLGNDLLFGADGSDTLTGGGGKDKLAGGDGPDRLAGSGSPDQLNGEGGDDRLYGDDGDDRLDGGGNVDRLWGGSGNDYLDGGSSNDRLFGEAGNDTLTGGSSGADYLDGGSSNDRATGPLAGDTLISIESQG